ncbi:MAG: hypothetical protein CMG75_03005 [Candidatus Marinimicrobia bacterium]|nr:hypothetical protein [Candidatus Neomarinimicrobiota bacterium]|tara:strand:- start:9087 stop:10475 length:1389 start_codon:yes stop_codon:yes gene_type:complete
MRFFEIISILLAFVVIINLSIRKFLRRETLLLIFINIIFTIIHLIIEGYRWQMIPLYFLLGLFVFIKNKEFRLSISLVLIMTWLLAILLPFLIPIISLSNPTGSFNIGSKIYDWTDSSRVELFTNDPLDFRNIVVQFWYPSKEHHISSPLPYLDHMKFRSKAIGDRVGLPSFMLSHLALVKTNSYHNSSPSKGSFPLIIFSHGLGGMRTQNTILMEELASNGYIVVAMDHAFDANTTVFPTLNSDGNLKFADYRSAIPEGTSDSLWLKIRNNQLDTRISDIFFILQKLDKKETLISESIDFTKIGVVGHSFGGATAVLSAMSNERIKAVVALDGWFVPFALLDNETQLNVPFLYIGQERWDSWNEKRHLHYLDLLIKQSTAVAYHISVKGAKHYDFADVPLFSPIAPIIGLTGFPNGKQIVRIVNSTTLQFFNKYLKNNLNYNFSTPSLPTISVRNNQQSYP